MSYSFKVQGSSHAAVLALAGREFESIVESFPAHKIEISEAERSAQSFVRLMPESVRADIVMVVHGRNSLTLDATSAPALQSVNFSISIHCIPRQSLGD